MQFSLGSIARPVTTSGRRMLVIAAAVLGMAGLAGCKGKFPQGHYEGNLSKILDGKIAILPVGIDINLKDKEENIKVQDAAKQRVLNLTVSILSDHTIALKIPTLVSESVKLSKLPQSSCFSGQKGVFVDLCYDERDFIIRVLGTEREPVFTLSGSRFAAQENFPMDKPRAYTLDEAVEAGLGKNFSSRLEFEKMYQAKKIVLAAYLSLLPKFSLFPAMAMVMYSPISLIFQIGDMAPFLLPSRWFHIQQIGFLAKAEETAFTLMQANLASEIESLAYSYERDRNTLRAYETLIGKVIEVQNKLVAANNRIESKGDLGTKIAHLEMFIKAMTLDVLKATAIVRSDRFALAQSLGLHHPEGVEDLTLSHEEIDVRSAKPIDSQALADTALKRSFEIQQMDYVIESAKWENKAALLYWLDPQGDSRFSIGPALLPMIQIGKSKLKELLIKREQIQSLIVQKAYEVAAGYNESIMGYFVAEELFMSSETSLRSLLEAGEEIRDVSDLEAKVGRYLVDLIRVESMLANFRISRSTLDRLCLQGYYMRLMERLLPVRMEMGRDSMS